MGTLRGFPNPPARSYGEQSSPPLTRLMGTLRGFPNPPARSYGEQSSPPLTRLMGTPSLRWAGTGRPRLMGTLSLRWRATGRPRLGGILFLRMRGAGQPRISLLIGRVRDWVSRLCCTRELEQDHSTPRQGGRSQRSPVANATLGFARDGGRRPAPAPRRQGGDRSVDRDRLLLRLRHRAVRAGGRRSHRRGDAQDRRREPAVRAPRRLARR